MYKYVHGHQAYVVFLITDMVVEYLPAHGPVATC